MKIDFDDRKRQVHVDGELVALTMDAESHALLRKAVAALEAEVGRVAAAHRAAARKAAAILEKVGGPLPRQLPTVRTTRPYSGQFVGVLRAVRDLAVPRNADIKDYLERHSLPVGSLPAAYRRLLDDGMLVVVGTHTPPRGRTARVFALTPAAAEALERWERAAA